MAEDASAKWSSDAITTRSGPTFFSLSLRFVREAPFNANRVP